MLLCGAFEKIRVTTLSLFMCVSIFKGSDHGPRFVYLPFSLFVRKDGAVLRGRMALQYQRPRVETRVTYRSLPAQRSYAMQRLKLGFFDLFFPYLISAVLCKAPLNCNYFISEI